MLQQLSRMVLRGAGPERCYECRLCGTSVRADTKLCPECGSVEIGFYVIA